MVANLATNAIEACLPGGGNVSIATGHRPAYAPGNQEAADLPDAMLSDYVYFQVRDTGSGIAADDRLRIFEPFFTRKSVGRGLGLAAVAGIVRSYSGGIEVVSAPGQGTTFTVYLPSKSSLTAQPVVNPNAIPAASVTVGNTVMVVDDDESMRETTALALELEGYAVVKAEDGEKAVELLRADPAKYAAIMLDLTMPNMDGARAFEEMLKIKPDVRVLIVSGFANDEVIAQLRGKRPAAILRKPFDLDDVFRHLRGNGSS